MVSSWAVDGSGGGVEGVGVLGQVEKERLGNGPLIGLCFGPVVDKSFGSEVWGGHWLLRENVIVRQRARNGKGGVRGGAFFLAAMAGTLRTMLCQAQRPTLLRAQLRCAAHRLQVLCLLSLYLVSPP